MKVLIACEESQTICVEFRKLGVEAYSCDLKECSGGHPEWHLKMDIFDAIKLDKYDLLIAHPPCTFLCISGNRWMNDSRYPNRWKDREEAIAFFLKIANIDIPHIAIENPVGVMSKIYKKPSQIIQPWMFGDSYQKTTCLWLKNLPNLVPTNIVDKGEFHITKSGRKIPEWYNNANRMKSKYGQEGVRTLRSKTFPGIAKAIATQWTEYLRKEDEQ